jgi:uncharacterized protein YutE (UPF0331/DUF86 family)
VVDATIIANKIAAIRDAVDRVRDILPSGLETFRADRTAREVVVLNVFVALQETVSLAAHWLADSGMSVPASYREIFLELADRQRIPLALAQRLAAAASFRNLVAHRYAALDPARVYAIASNELRDLLKFCEIVSRETAGDDAA